MDRGMDKWTDRCMGKRIDRGKAGRRTAGRSTDGQSNWFEFKKIITNIVELFSCYLCHEIFNQSPTPNCKQINLSPRFLVCKDIIFINCFFIVVLALVRSSLFFLLPCLVLKIPLAPMGALTPRVCACWTLCPAAH